MLSAKSYLHPIFKIMGQLQKGPPHHAAMRWQAASLLAGLLLAALLISSGRGGGGAWRDRWLLTVLRLDVGGGGAAAPGARADASSAGTLLAQEQQRVELDLVFVVKGDPEQQKKAAEARQRPQGVSAGRPPLAAPPADAARPRERQLRCAVYNGVSCFSWRVYVHPASSCACTVKISVVPRRLHARLHAPSLASVGPMPPAGAIPL